MHLLDTDTLAYLHAGHGAVVERLRQCDDVEIGIAVVTKAEALRARCDFLLAERQPSQSTGKASGTKSTNGGTRFARPTLRLVEGTSR